MRKLLSCLFILTLTFLIGFGIYSVQPDTIARDEVLRLTKEFHEAERNRDEDALERILGDEISYSRYSDQKIISRENFIEHLKNIEFNIESIRESFVSSEVVNNEKLKVYFTMQLTFISEDNKLNNHIGAYTYTFEKQQNKWKLTAIHLEN